MRELLDFLDSGKIEVRRYENRFLHGKAFVFSGKQGVLAGSSNFTLAGLTSNLELNLGQYQPACCREGRGVVRPALERRPSVRSRRHLQGAVRRAPSLPDLSACPMGAVRRRTRRGGRGLGPDPAHALPDRRGVPCEADPRADTTAFWSPTAWDSGKSFIAAEIFTEVIERNRQRALLIAPAQLRDGMWRQFRRRYQVGIEVVSFEQLAGDRQLGQGDGSALGSNIGDYSLVVIDEAHAFRNADTKRARALRQLLRGDPPRKVVLLTATPVNNSLWDLYDLLTYFVGHDAVFADRGIPSLKERFRQADKEDPFSLSPDTLFDILDATTVRRTRHFVQRFYPNDNFRLQDGTEVTIRFPDPVVRSRSYDLDEVLPGFFDEFAEVLDAGEGEPRLTMARYWPTRYRRDGVPDARETALVGLIRSGLLKRFESSAKAFDPDRQQDGRSAR